MNAPHDCAVAHFLCDFDLVFVTFLCKIGDLLVEFKERCVTTGDNHVFRVSIEHDVVAAHLRIRRLVHFKPLLEEFVLSVVGFAVLCKSVPVPFLAGVFFDEVNCRNHLISGVGKDGFLLVAHRRSHREGREIVVSVFDLVAHKRAVASGVAVNRANAADGEVFVDCGTEFCARHRADVGRNLEFF